ncbi:MAG: pilus assembly protein N-terminal domain-containing protein [Pseudolabrys sp.]|jgi:hypothetical protein
MPAVRPRRKKIVLAVALMAMLAGSAGSSIAADTVVVAVDQAQLMRVPERTATIIVGNPLIADVSLQTGGVLVVTGKGYGTTNFLALDRSGNTLSNQQIVVKSPGDNVAVFYGTARQSYSCEPLCEPRVMLGDNKDFFNNALQQTAARNGSAATGGGTGGPGGSSGGAR